MTWTTHLTSLVFISSSENGNYNYNKLTELLRERKEQINEGMMKRKVKINTLEDTGCLYNINFSILLTKQTWEVTKNKLSLKH